MRKDVQIISKGDTNMIKTKGSWPHSKPVVKIEEDDVENVHTYHSAPSAFEGHLLKLKSLKPFAAPRHVRKGVRFISRVLQRQRRIHRHTYWAQVIQGRPDDEFRRCFATQCTRYQCLYKNIYYQWASRTWSSKLILVEEYEETFLKEMARRFYNGPLHTRDSSLEAIQSFMKSPPVVGMFGWFIDSTGESIYSWSPIQMAQVLTTMHDYLIRIIGRTRRSSVAQHINQTFSYSYQARPSHNGQLSKYLKEFFMVIESWRRYSLQMGYRLDWDFGDDESTAGLLEAVFLNMWCMHRDECGIISKGRGAVDHWWDMWLDQFPPAWSEGSQSSRMEVSPISLRKTSVQGHPYIASQKEAVVAPNYFLGDVAPPAKSSAGNIRISTTLHLASDHTKPVEPTDHQKNVLEQTAVLSRTSPGNEMQPTKERESFEGYGVAKPCWIYSLHLNRTVLSHKTSRRLFVTEGV